MRMKNVMMAMSSIILCFTDASSAVAQACGPVRSYAFVDGKDTLAIERVFVTDTSFRSDVYASSQGALVKYDGRLNSLGVPTKLVSSIWPSAKDSLRPASQIAEVSLGTKAFTARVRLLDGREQQQVDSVKPGTFPYIANSMVLLEVLARAVKKSSADSSQIQVAWLFTTGRHDAVVAKKTSSAVTLTFADHAVTIEHGADGMPLVVRAKDGSVMFVRTGCGAPKEGH